MNPHRECEMDLEVLEKSVGELNGDGKSSPSPAFVSGWKGWTTVIGSWLVLFALSGYNYSFGVYQDYYSRIFVTNASPSQISWIGSVQLMLTFSISLIAGPLFDKGHFRPLLIAGSSLFTLSLFMLSLAKSGKYYQLFLSQGIGAGIGSGLIFTPCLSIQARHFPPHRRALVTALALTGAGCGGVVFPILLNKLLQVRSFGYSVRASAYIVLGCVVLGNLLVYDRPPRVQSSQSNNIPRTSDLLKRFAREPAYLCMCIGMFIHAVGIFFPIFYIQLFAVQHNVDPSLAFYAISIINASTVIGRPLANQIGQLIGLYKMLVICAIGTGATIWGTLALNNKSSFIVITIIYGMTSGAVFSLAPVIVMTLSHAPQEIGLRMGLCFSIMGLAILLAAPIQGALLTRQYEWIRPVALSSTLCFIGSFCYAVAGILVNRYKQMSLA